MNKKRRYDLRKLKKFEKYGFWFERSPISESVYAYNRATSEEIRFSDHELSQNSQKSCTCYYPFNTKEAIEILKKEVSESIDYILEDIVIYFWDDFWDDQCSNDKQSAKCKKSILLYEINKIKQLDDINFLEEINCRVEDYVSDFFWGISMKDNIDKIREILLIKSSDDLVFFEKEIKQEAIDKDWRDFLIKMRKD